MGDEILKPVAPKESEPFANRWGLALECGPRFSISTSISEGGVGGVCGLSLDIAENFDKVYQLKLDVPFGTTDQKLFPTTDAEGTSADHSHWAFRLGFGNSTRAFTHYGKDGDYRLSLNVGSTPMLGVGSSTISRAPYELDGETFDFEETSDRTFDIGTSYFLLAELRPGKRFPAFKIGPAFHYGLQYAGEGSEFNRLKLEFMIMASVGYGDASTVSGTDADMELGAMGIFQGFYGLGHGYVQRYVMIKSLLQPMEALDEYGLTDTEGSDDRGSMAGVPFLSAAASVMGGPSLSPALHSGKGWYWGFAAAHAAGGLFLISDSTDAKGAGLGDLLGTARLLGYAIANIETPDARFAKESAEVQRREMYLNLASYALNSVVFFIGAAADSDVAIIGGSSANNSLVMSPDPIERGMAESTSYGYIPYTGYWGKRSGNRAGMIIHNSWRDVPHPNFQLYSAMTFVSPMMTFGNIGRAANENEAYADVMLPSDVGAELGLEGDWTWFSIGGGIRTVAIFGGEDDARSAFGGALSATVKLPFNGKEDGVGLALGLRGTADYVFGQGGQFEISPTISLTLPNTW